MFPMLASVLEASLRWLPLAAATACCVVVLLGLYLWSSVQSWKNHYPEKVPRSHPCSPSHRGKPELQRVDSKSGLKRSGSRRRSVSGCPAAPFFPEEGPSEAVCPVTKQHAATGPRALSMDMDHIHITLPQCLLFSLWVALPSTLYAIYGYLRLQVVKALMRWGWITEPSAQAMHRMVFHLCVDTLATGLTSMERNEAEEEVAHFEYLVPFYEDTSEGSLEFSAENVMKVCVNMEQRRVVQATLNQTEISLTDTVLLLVHTASHVSHVKVHAYANWGVDPALEEQDPYLRTMGLITVCYNHSGFDTAPKLMSTVVGAEAGAAMKECFVAALKQGVPEHGDVVRLMPYSKHVSFLVKIRHHFQEAFEKFRSDLPASVSCEGLFLGTVLHALDHDAYNNAVDWVAFAAMKPSAKFQTVHAVNQIVGFMIADDIPTVGVPKYYRDSKMDFHKAVYAAGRLIDVDFADRMQSCIIK